MKNKEEFKKLIKMKRDELLKEKEAIEKAYCLSRYEVTCKKSENFKKIEKNRKLKARILTIINSKTEKDERV